VILVIEKKALFPALLLKEKGAKVLPSKLSAIQMVET